MAPSPLLLAVLALLLAERGFELVIDRRNRRALAGRGAVGVERDGFPLIVAAQAALFAGAFVEGGFAPWGGAGVATLPLLGVLLLAQALRYWCITTLGERWSVRVVTLPGAPRILAGPYRFFPHPNYAAVMMEAVALPLAFGAYATLAFVVPLQLWALRRRVRIEERALTRATSQP